jgi:hypothetical protein
MIYTSYFGNREIWNDPRCVSIALYPPASYKGSRCSKLYPAPSLLACWKARHDEQAYTEQYNAMLATLDPHACYRALEGKILLCYESRYMFCHRHLVAKWLIGAGYSVIEL